MRNTGGGGSARPSLKLIAYFVVKIVQFFRCFFLILAKRPHWVGEDSMIPKIYTPCRYLRHGSIRTNSSFGRFLIRW